MSEKVYTIDEIRIILEKILKNFEVKKAILLDRMQKI